MRKLLTISPSSAFVDCEIGTVVEIGKKRYIILDRDPWVVYALRYYWFDKLAARIWRKFEDKDRAQPES